MHKRYFVVMVFILICLYARPLNALSVNTHKQINEFIVSNTLNGFLLDNTLRKIGFQKGIDEKFNDKKVWEPIGDGGWYEDKPPEWYSIDWTYLRAFNHFYTPTTDSGLSGGPYDSALSWALRPPGEQFPYGHLSWFDVRNYFYLALTAETKADRDANYANTFRGLGQLMHLVSDMSVPEHTRHDIHIFDIDYENYVTKHIGEILFPTTPDPDNPGSTLQFKPKFFGGVLSKDITPLFDSGQYVYNGTNPDVTINSNIGLAEFSNANFLSDESIFVGYTYPKIDNLTIWSDPGVKNRKYAWKHGEGVEVKHLVALGASAIDRKRIFPQDSNNEILVELDDAVYKNYADILIPRAVGYSADMLKYFFRGDVAIVKNANGEDVIKNNSGDALSGTFTLYSDDASGIRHNAGVIYSGSIPKGGESAKVTITAPTDHTPVELGKYMLVFKGDMGGEAGAVAASVVKPNQPSYVFIIQETAEMNSTPVETVQNLFDGSKQKRRKWDVTKQTMSGIFKAYGNIKKISLWTWSDVKIGLKIDGVTAPGRSWVRDANTVSNPKTWSLYADPAWGFNGAWYTYMIVTMSDDKVFMQDIFGYVDVNNWTSTISSFYFDISGSCYNQYGTWGYGTKQNANINIWAAVKDRFIVRRIGGYEQPFEYKNPVCNNYELQTLFTANGVSFLKQKYNFKTYWYYEFPSVQLAPYLELVPSATIERIYSDDELKSLEKQGVTPEYYTIIMN